MKSIERIATEIVLDLAKESSKEFPGKITFVNYRSMKDAFSLLEKELKDLVVRRKSVSENSLFFRNTFAVKKAIEILKRKRMDSDIKKIVK